MATLKQIQWAIQQGPDTRRGKKLQLDKPTNFVMEGAIPVHDPSAIRQPVNMSVASTERSIGDFWGNASDWLKSVGDSVWTSTRGMSKKLDQKAIEQGKAFNKGKFMQDWIRGGARRLEPLMEKFVKLTSSDFVIPKRMAEDFEKQGLTKELEQLKGLGYRIKDIGVEPEPEEKIDPATESPFEGLKDVFDKSLFPQLQSQIKETFLNDSNIQKAAIYISENIKDTSEEFIKLAESVEKKKRADSFIRKDMRDRARRILDGAPMSIDFENADINTIMEMANERMLDPDFNRVDVLGPEPAKYFVASFLDGITGGLIHDPLLNLAPQTTSEKIARVSGGGVGVVIGIGKVSKVLSAVLSPTRFVQWATKLSPITRNAYARILKPGLDFTIYGQINPELRLDWDKRLEQAMTDAKFGVAFGVVGGMFPGKLGIPVMGTIGYQMSAMNGGDDIENWTNSLVFGLLHTKGVIDMKDAAGFTADKARKSVNKFTKEEGLKIPRRYTDEQLTESINVARTKIQSNWKKGKATEIQTADDSLILNRADRILRKIPVEERKIMKNPISNIKNKINTLKQEAAIITKAVKEKSWRKIKIEPALTEDIMQPTKPGKPKISKDGKSVVTGDIKITIGKSNVKKLISDGQTRYTNRLNSLINELRQTQDVKKRDDIRQRIDALRIMLGKQFGYEGPRLTDIFNVREETNPKFLEQPMSDALDNLAFFYNSIRGMKVAQRENAFERLRATVDNFSKEGKFPARDLSREIVRRAEIASKNKAISLEYIPEEQIVQITKGKRAAQILDNLPDIKVKVAKVPEPEVITPKKEISTLEQDIRNLYSSKQEAVEGALGEVLTELEVSQPGQRLFTEAGEVLGFPSTFPKWIPEHLRSKKLFNLIFDRLTSIEKMKFPEPDPKDRRTNRANQRELLNEILNEVDTRVDLDSSAPRDRILELYGQIIEAKKIEAAKLVSKVPRRRVPVTKEKEVKVPEKKKVKPLTEEETIKIIQTVEKTGAPFKGIQKNPFGEDLVLFDNKLGSTLALPLSKVTVENVKKKLIKSLIEEKEIKIPEGFEKELEIIKTRPEFGGRKGKANFNDENRLIQVDPKTKLRVISRQFTKEEMEAIAGTLGIKLPEKISDIIQPIAISKKPENKVQKEVRAETDDFLKVEQILEENIQIVPDVLNPHRAEISFKNYEFTAIKDRDGELQNIRVDKDVSQVVPKSIITEVRDYFKNIYNPKLAKPVKGDTVLGFVPKEKSYSAKEEPIFKPIEQFSETKSGELIRRSEIMDLLSESFLVPIRRGKFRKKALAIFKEQPEIIRIKEGSVESVSHEIGHRIQKQMPEFSRGNVTPFLRELSPIATKGKKWQEGFAEFVKRYVVEPETLNQVAPRFKIYFEEVLNVRYPEARDALLTARKMTKGWKSQSSVEKVRSVISLEGKENVNWKDRLTSVTTWRDNMWHAWVNDLNPIRKYVKRAKKLGIKLDVAEDPEVLGLLMRSSTSVANSMLEIGTFGKGWLKVKKDANGKVLEADPTYKGKSLKQIWKEGIVNKYGHTVLEQDFSVYLISRRAIELGRREEPIKTGIDIRDAVNSVKELEAKFPEFKEVARETFEFQKDVLEYARDHGLISNELFEKFLEMNKDYVPFFRVMDPIGLDKKALKGALKQQLTSKNFAKASSFKKIKGSEREFVDPLESIVKNTFAIVHAAQRNQVLVALANLSLRHPELGQMFEKIPTPLNKVATVKAEEFFARNELDLIPKEMREKVVDVFRPSFFMDGTVVTVMMGGKRQFFEVRDADLYKSLISSESSPELIIGLKGVFEAPTQWLRTGAILNPEFMARNPTRDTLTSFVYSKYGFTFPGYDVIRGISRIVGGSKWYHMYQMSGAAHSNFISMDRNYIKTNIRNLTASKGKLLGIKVKNPFALVRDTLRDLSELTENASRIEEFRRGIMHNASPIEAAYAAKDITLNYTRAGQHGRVANKFFAFFNARVQGIDKLGREFIEHPVRMNAKAFLSITAPSLILYGINRDDPDYWELPEWRRDLFWNIKIKKEGKVKWISIPKPFELGLIYGTSAEKFWEYLDKRDRRILTDYFTNIRESELLGGLMPISKTSPFPTVLNPLIENWTNYDFFRERPVVPLSLTGLEPEEQYSFYTTETAKSFAFLAQQIRKTGVTTFGMDSPLKVQNVIDGYFAGLGRYGTTAIDSILKGTGIVKPPELPEKDLITRIPFLKALVIEGPTGSASQSVNVFYEKLEELERWNKTFNKRMKDGNIEGATQLMKDHPEMVLVKQFRSLRNQFANMRITQRQIIKSNIDKKEKRKMIDLFNRLMTDMSAASLNYVLQPIARPKKK